MLSWNSSFIWVGHMHNVINIKANTDKCGKYIKGRSGFFTYYPVSMASSNGEIKIFIEKFKIRKSQKIDYQIYRFKVKKWWISKFINCVKKNDEIIIVISAIKGLLLSFLERSKSIIHIILKKKMVIFFLY